MNMNMKNIGQQYIGKKNMENNPERMKRMMKDIERNMNYSKIKELLDQQGITIEENKDEDSDKLLLSDKKLHS